MTCYGMSMSNALSSIDKVIAIIEYWIWTKLIQPWNKTPRPTHVDPSSDVEVMHVFWIWDTNDFSVGSGATKYLKATR